MTFFLNALKGSSNSPAVDLLGLDTLTGNIPGFLTPKGTTSTLVLFLGVSLL